MKAIRVEVTITAPLDKVWRAWTDPGRLSQWFAPEARIEARLGGPFELYFDIDDYDHQCTRGCTITVFKPQRRLGFSWKGPDQFAELMNNPALTSVGVTFHQKHERVHVVLKHGGWRKGKEWEQAREWHRREWEAALQRLKTVTETPSWSRPID